MVVQNQLLRMKRCHDHWMQGMSSIEFVVPQVTLVTGIEHFAAFTVQVLQRTTSTTGHTFLTEASTGNR